MASARHGTAASASARHGCLLAFAGHHCRSASRPSLHSDWLQRGGYRALHKYFTSTTLAVLLVALSQPGAERVQRRCISTLGSSRCYQRGCCPYCESQLLSYQGMPLAAAAAPRSHEYSCRTRAAQCMPVGRRLRWSRRWSRRCVRSCNGRCDSETQLARIRDRPACCRILLLQRATHLTRSRHGARP